MKPIEKRIFQSKVNKQTNEKTKKKKQKNDGGERVRRGKNGEGGREEVEWSLIAEI